MGDKTDLNIKIDNLQEQIDQSQVKDRNRMAEFIVTNWKSIAMIGSAMGILGPGQLAAFTLPSLEKAKMSGAEAAAVRDTLRMTSANWMSEIAAAREDERADCKEQKETLNEHWQWRMENHVH